MHLCKKNIDWQKLDFLEYQHGHDISLNWWVDEGVLHLAKSAYFVET